MLNWTPQSRNEEKTFAAVPPDVRKGSAFPKHLGSVSGEAKPRALRRSLSEDLTFIGKPEAFCTSSGEAARRSPL